MFELTMWIYQHPYLFFYLLGSGLVPLLALFKVTLVWLIAWITKENILEKNLKKLLPPDESHGDETFGTIAAFALEIALSWITVVVGLWQISVIVLKVVREAFSSTPETVKLLRFPLRNNPDMSPEAVWAYVHAIGIRSGNKQPDAKYLLYLLNNVREVHHFFNREAALNQLKSLNVVSDEAISSACQLLTQPEEQSDEEI
jgi:hypothetical protein